MSRVSTSSLHAPLFSFPSPHHPLYLLLPSIPLRFPPRLASSLRRQPEISEFVWNSLPVLLGAIEADRPSTTTDGRRQRSGRSWDARPRRSERASGRAECEWIMPRRYSTPGPLLRSAVGVGAVPLRCSAAPLQPETSVLAHSGVHADSPLREATGRDQTSDTASQSSACTIFPQTVWNFLYEITILFRHITCVRWSCGWFGRQIMVPSPSPLRSLHRTHLFPPALLDSTLL